MGKSRSMLFNIVVAFMFSILCFLTLYPFVYAFSYSVSDGLLAAKNGVVLLPQGFTLQNYRMIFYDSRILHALFISFSRTILGASLFLIVTGLCAYSMSKQRLKGRKMLFIFFVIPMYVSGGMLPFYILIYNLGLMNNYLVYILPTSFATFFMFLIKVYLETIPESLEESASIEGAGDLHIAFRIYLPLAKPVIATVLLFVGVQQWNSWFDALLFVTKSELQPLQLVLQNILRENQIDSITKVFQMGTGTKRMQISADTYKMAVLIITTLPIILSYPFAQKYFVKGMTLGSVKQ